MTNHNELTTLGDLVLVRLLTAVEKGATLAQVKKDLGPLVEHRWTGAALTEALERTFQMGESDGSIRRVKPLRGKIDQFRITPEGVPRGLAFLGVAELPPKATWATIKKTLLLARALGLGAPRGEDLARFSKDPGFKAALLRAQFDLPIRDYPTAKEAADALYWKLVGLGSNGHKKFDVKSLLAALFNRELGEHRQASAAREVDRLLARKLDARRGDAKEFRNVVFRQWLDGASKASVDEGPAPAPEPLGLRAFAQRVVSTARASRDGRFGDDKVFIAHLWRALAGDPATAGMDLDGFKRRLAEANRDRFLNLSRADLVEAMDAAEVRDSETRFLGATFHFVSTRLPGDPD